MMMIMMPSWILEYTIIIGNKTEWVDLSSKEKTECRRLVPQKFKKTVNTWCAQISNFQHIPELSWHIPPEEIDGWVGGRLGEKGGSLTLDQFSCISFKFFKALWNCKVLLVGRRKWWESFSECWIFSFFVFPLWFSGFWWFWNHQASLLHQNWKPK